MVAAVLLVRSHRKLKQAQEALSQSQEYLELLALTLRATGVAVFNWEIDRDIITSDDNCSIQFGLPPGQFPRTVQELIARLHPDDRERVQQEVTAAVQGGAAYDTEFRVVWPQGAIRHLAARGRVHARSGHAHHLTGTCWDVTESHQAAEEFRAANEKLSDSLRALQRRKEHSETFSDMADLLQACPDSSEAYAIVTKFCAHLLPELAGALYIFSASRNLVNSVATWNDVTIDAAFEPNDCWALRRGQPHIVAPHQFATPCRHLKDDQRGHACFPLMAQGNGLGIIYFQSRQRYDTAASEPFLDSEERELAHHIAEQVAMSVANLHLREALRLQTIRDSLTGLHNRRYLEESVERELHRMARRNQPAGFAMMDLDHFKAFNDSFGHEGGDALLRAFGQFLREHLRKEDIACRFGGEEFCVLFSECSLDDTVRAVEQLRSQVKRLTVEHGGQQLAPVTMSAGVAAYPNHGTTVTDLIGAADSALYQAKANGRDCVVTATTPPAATSATADNLRRP